MYLKLLRRFLEQESVPQQIAHQLSGGERLTAERLAHSLKGTAASLGIGAVQSAAAALERALREGAESQGLQAELRLALEDFLSRLRPALPPEESVESEFSGFDRAALIRLVLEMDARLAEFDVAAVEIFEANRGIFSGPEFADLARQLSDYELAGARTTLRQAAARLEISLPC